MAEPFDDSPNHQFRPYPSAAPTATDIHQIIEQVRRQAEIEARTKYEVTMHEHIEKLKRAPLVDELKDLVSYGDIVIRKVGNGYVIRRIPGDYMRPMDGGCIETWVVEGNDIKGVADQLTAMQATDTMRESQGANLLGAIGGGQNIRVTMSGKSLSQTTVDTDAAKNAHRT